MKVFKTYVHPEATADEVWCTNVFITEPQFESIKYLTKRMGLTAYFSNGLRLGSSYNCRPVFVSKKEIEAAGFIIEYFDINIRQ